MIDNFTVPFDGKDYPCFYINTKDKAEKLIEQLSKKSGILAADCETAALPEWRHIPDAALSPHLAAPRLIQLFTGTGVAVIDLYGTGAIDLKSIFEKRPSVFHNMTFDYKMLRQHFGVVDPDMHCTCIMARCVWHALYPDDKKADLRSVCIALFGEEINKKGGRSDWSILELTFEQIRYAALDAIVQMRVYEKLDSYIEQLNLRKVYDLYRSAQLAFCEMELNGVTLDKNTHINNVVKWREELIDAKEAVLKMTGLSRITDNELAGWLEQTLPPEVLEIWPRTQEGEGKLSTDANTFVDFSYLDIVKPFSRYQKLKKLTTSFGMNLLHMINPATGKLHPGYRLAGARTGRVSCSEPNIQQMPRSPTKEERAAGAPDIRATFVPSPGYVLVVADYSQVEVRCIAEFSNDPMMLKAYEDGLDMYSYTAAHLTGKKYKDIGKKSAERQRAKALVLGLNYGLGYKKFTHYAKKGYGVEMTEGEASDLVKAYRKLYATLRKWQMKQVDLSAARKYTAFSAMGKSRKMYEDKHFCACMNHPIQGTCAEIMLKAAAYCRIAFRGTSGRLLICVHDELVSECLPKDTELIKKIKTECMVRAYSEILTSGRTVRDLVEPSFGVNWAEAKGD